MPALGGHIVDRAEGTDLATADLTEIPDGSWMIAVLASNGSSASATPSGWSSLMPFSDFQYCGTRTLSYIGKIKTEDDEELAWGTQSGTTKTLALLHGTDSVPVSEWTFGTIGVRNEQDEYEGQSIQAGTSTTSVAPSVVISEAESLVVSVLFEATAASSEFSITTGASQWVIVPEESPHIEQMVVGTTSPSVGTTDEVVATATASQAANGQGVQIVLPAASEPEPDAGVPVHLHTPQGLVSGRGYLHTTEGLLTPYRAFLSAARPGFTVNDLLADEPFYVAHRCGGGNWPEFSIRGIEQSIALGYKALEISVDRCATGEWVCSHDWTTERMTGAYHEIWDTSWATLSTLTSTAEYTTDTGQSRTHLITLEQALAVATDRVLFIDHKATSAGNENNADAREDLLDYLDTIPGSTDRFVWKVFKDGYLSAQSAATRGYKTWGIYYASEIEVSPTHIEDFDILGMEWPDAQEYWDIAKAAGKPVIGHIINNSGQRNEAIAKGADGIMSAVPALMGP